MALADIKRLGLTKTGQGARIESISRGANVLIVPGKVFPSSMRLS